MLSLLKNIHPFEPGVRIRTHHQYRIQPQMSQIEFRVDSPIGEISATFHDFAGSFSVQQSKQEDTPVLMNVNTDSLDTHSGFIGAMLKGESFFDVEKFPTMTFSGTTFEWINQNCAVLKGIMTIKNVSREVTFYVELVQDDTAANTISDKGDRLTMKATASIKRSDFNIDTLLPVVSDDVHLYVSISAVRSSYTTASR